MILILQSILSLLILLLIYCWVKERLKNDKLSIQNLELNQRIINQQKMINQLLTKKGLNDK